MRDTATQCKANSHDSVLVGGSLVHVPTTTLSVCLFSGIPEIQLAKPVLWGHYKRHYMSTRTQSGELLVIGIKFSSGLHAPVWV